MGEWPVTVRPATPLRSSESRFSIPPYRMAPAELREIASIKVQWKNRAVEEATWEKEADMREKYPHLFTDSGIPFRPCFPSFDRSGTNDG